MENRVGKLVINFYDQSSPLLIRGLGVQISFSAPPSHSKNYTLLIICFIIFITYKYNPIYALTQLFHFYYLFYLKTYLH